MNPSLKMFRAYGPHGCVVDRSADEINFIPTICTGPMALERIMAPWKIPIIPTTLELKINLRHMTLANSVGMNRVVAQDFNPGEQANEYRMSAVGTEHN